MVIVMTSVNFCALMVMVAFAGLARAEVKDSQSGDTGFFVLGAGFGMPSGVAIVGGYDFGPVGLRVSGGGWAKGWYGVQGDLAVHFNRAAPFAHGMSIIAGRFGANPLNDQGEKILKTQKFIGITYDVYLSGFFLQAGLAFGNGDYPSPDGVYQCGYLFEF
jgi:hypothetical protein